MAQNETTIGFEVLPIVPDTICVSKKELAKKYKMDYISAQGLVSFLVATGKAKLVAKRKSLSGKGKPTEIFEIPTVVTLEFAA